MRFLHTMIRVRNLEESIRFYTESMGMKLIRTWENTPYKYTIAFLGYESNPDQAEIELTYNWGVDSYEMGTAFGHLAIGCDDIHATVERVRATGGKVTREVAPVKGGVRNIAFVEDPDGYQIELKELN